MITIPQGYTDSKVGIIPTNWEVVSISNQFDFLKTYSNSRNDLESEGEIQYLHYGDIHTKYKYHLDFSKNKLPKLSVNKIKGEPVIVKNGDVFIADASEDYDDIGKSVEAKNINDKKVIAGLHTFLLRDKADNFVNGYKGFILYNSNVAKEIKRIATGISVLGISKTNLGKLLIPKPPKEEQQIIAEILTTWDKAIEQQEALIKEKEQLKKGLMQKLLSGEKRFDGFDDEWEEVQLNTFTVERNIKSPKSKEYPLMAFVAYKGVTDKGDRYNREFLVSDESNKKYKQTEYGDFIYSSNNLETGSIGMNRYGSATISPVYSIFQITESCDAKFMSNFLVTKSFISKMVRYRQGVMYGQWRIHESDFLRIKVKIPCLEEQTKIGKVLSIADNELDLLQKELEELKLQKKGLMQNLLTGKVRVKV